RFPQHSERHCRIVHTAAWRSRCDSHIKWLDRIPVRRPMPLDESSSEFHHDGLHAADSRRKILGEKHDFHILFETTASTARTNVATFSSGVQACIRSFAAAPIRSSWERSLSSDCRIFASASTSPHGKTLPVSPSQIRSYPAP